MIIIEKNRRRRRPIRSPRLPSNAPLRGLMTNATEKVATDWNVARNGVEPGKNTVGNTVADTRANSVKS
jgi:hypothetical protein